MTTQVARPIGLPLHRAPAAGRRPALRVVVLAAAVFLAHLAVAAWGPYELHRDALLYLAMGEHLHLLRMDFPPLIALVARVERLLGDSLVVIHVAPAAAHAALVLLAGAFARLAGGGKWAQLMAALAVATAAIFLRAGSLFQPVVFDQLWWTLALYTVARIGGDLYRGRRADGRRERGDFVRLPASEGGRWVVLGLVLGLGLLTKFTIFVLGAGLLVGLLATPLRRFLITPWPWAAAALAFVVGSPSISGQVLLDWPFFAQLGDLRAVQLSRLSPASFVTDQLLLVGPAVLLAVVGAVAAVLRGDPGLRAVGWTAAAAFLLMLLADGKPYYIAPIWPALLGIGMAEAEGWIRRLRRRRSVAAAGAGALITVAVVGWGAVVLPLGLPFLPPAPMARYATRLGVEEAVTTNTGEVLSLPQDYADMLGWEALADSVARVYRDLPPDDREEVVILATNYGRAGAIDFYAGDEIPHAVAPVGSYWFWGPGDRPGRVTIVVGAEVGELVDEYFRVAVEATRVRNPWGVPEERDVPIVVARQPVRPLQDIWPSFRGVN